jgi:uracil-DNA glycosylase family 4
MPPVMDTLERIAAEVRVCVRCRLRESRIRAVPGEGAPDAPLVLVGEAPGRSEDESGRPFQGPAGQFLDVVLAAIGVERSALFITSVNKCRPPRNRAPRADEQAACRGYLDRQLALIKPRVVLAMGGTAAAGLHPGVRGTTASVATLRGAHVLLDGGARLLVTYHPAAARRFPACREPFTSDLAAACRLAGLIS